MSFSEKERSVRMKKSKYAAFFLSLLMVLGGCVSPAEEAERLFRSDTVVNIPVNPEESEEPAPTEAETTAPPAEETVPETTREKSGSSGKSASASGGKTTKATEPPVTEPPATVPPETESPEAAVYDISDYVVGSMESTAAELLNTFRTEAELEPLAMDSRLCAIASVRAYEAALLWSHTRPNGAGWQTVLTDYGYGYTAAAEEVSRVSGSDVAAAVDSWMNSESSSANFLSGAYTTIGVGVYDAGGTVILAVVLIG